MTAYDVAVIGLGAMGSAALYHLARRGRRVIGMEQASPGHEGGSSHGESRIIRLAHYENPDYTPLVRRAYELWHALEREAGATLILPTGILEAGRPGAMIVEGSLKAARDQGLAHEVLSAGEANQRFPAFNLPGGWTALFQPGAGILRADAAIRLHMAGARAAGAEVRLGAVVTAIEPTRDGVRVVMGDGESLSAAAAIVSAGPWIADLVPELAPLLTLTRQPVAWFEPARPAETTPGRMPVFLVEDETDAIYGFPDFGGSGVKAASHVHGRTLAHAADARQDAGEADTAPIAQALRRFVPAAAGPLRGMKTCIYANTPDEEFIIDRSLAASQIVFASACSGHGFKFASVFGELLADMATSEATPPALAAFSLSRFARASANQAR